MKSLFPLCLNMPSIILLINLILFSSAVPPVYADTPTDKHYQTTIPYAPSEHGFIYVQVRVDNGRTGGGLVGTFILDTGASIKHYRQ